MKRDRFNLYEYRHQVYNYRKTNNLCVRCERQDERTLAGYINCEQCAERLKEMYERKKGEKNG